MDAGNNLYVADTNNMRVLEYNTPLTTDTIADTVFGQLGSFTAHVCSGPYKKKVCATLKELPSMHPATSTSRP